MKFDTKQQRQKKNITRIILIGLLFLAGTLIYITNLTANPVPQSIRSQVSFKFIIPISALVKIDSSSYSYDSDNKILSFIGTYQNNNIVFNEQTAPDTLGTDSQPYYQALGIHAYAQFKVALGTVVLTRFWQAGTLIPNGQSGLLLAKGTLLSIHTDKTLSNEQWKTLFNTTKIAQ